MQKRPRTTGSRTNCYIVIGIKTSAKHKTKLDTGNLKENLRTHNMDIKDAIDLTRNKKDGEILLYTLIVSLPHGRETKKKRN